MLFSKIKRRIVRFTSKIINKAFETKCRLRLRNKDFSIICSNCIGGLIYHRLGKEFLSPTVNLWIRQYDFIKLICDLDEYMKKELVFVSSEYDHPVAVLGDVTIYFNHSKSEEEAKADWERRKTRIRYDNLFIVMYDRDNLSREQILSLREVKCKRLIVLTETSKYPDIEYVYHISRTNKNRVNEQVFLDMDLFGLRTFEKQWDFVKWLNG